MNSKVEFNTIEHKSIRELSTLVNKLIVTLNIDLNKNIKKIFKDNNICTILDRVIEIQNNKKIELEKLGFSSLSIIIIEMYADINNKEILEEVENNNIQYDSNPDYLKYDGNNIYINQIKNIKLLTKEEEKELTIKYYLNKDKDARRRLVEANQRLVLKIARQFNGYSLSLMDLLQEGNLGLLKAIDKFNPNEGYKLSTYATYWIRNSIQKAIKNQSRNIRIPIHMYSKLKKYKELKNDLINKLEREPNINEIANYLNIDVKKVEIYERILNDTVSLNTLVGDGPQESELFEFIPDENAQAPDETVISKMTISELIKKLDCLTERERYVLLARSDVDGTSEKKLQEIGMKIGVTRERVRQIEAIAKRKVHISGKKKYLELKS